MSQQWTGRAGTEQGGRDGVASQLDESEIWKWISKPILKLVQGQVDAVTIEGDGLVMQKDLRKKWRCKMVSPSISALPSASELTKPTDASPRSSDRTISTAFNSEYVRQLQNQQVRVMGNR